MIPTRRLLTTILAAAIAAAAASPVASTVARDASEADARPSGRAVNTALPDATLPGKCSDQQVTPVSVVILCGDAGVVAEDLVWHDWGAARARASGTASVNTCKPTCAAQNRVERPIVVAADRLVDCAYGRPQYTRLTYSFPNGGTGSGGSGAARDRTVLFACPKRRHADPRIRAMQIRLTGPRIPGVRRAGLRLRVCAERGHASVVIKETRRLSGRTVRAHRQTRAFWQTKRCRWHAFTWPLRDELLGPGAYRVAATVWDQDGQLSKTASRTIRTIG